MSSTTSSRKAAFRNHFGVIDMHGKVPLILCTCRQAPWDVVGRVHYYVKHGDRVMFHETEEDGNVTVHALESSVTDGWGHQKCHDVFVSSE